MSFGGVCVHEDKGIILMGESGMGWVVAHDGTPKLAAPRITSGALHEI